MSAAIIAGGVVHHEYRGRGHPVIFIRGWVGSRRYWVPGMTVLAATYRAYAIDVWGYGDSDRLAAAPHLAGLSPIAAHLPLLDVSAAGARASLSNRERNGGGKCAKVDIADNIG